MHDLLISQTTAGLTFISATSDIGVAALRLAGAPNDRETAVPADQTGAFVNWALSVPLTLAFGPLPEPQQA